MNRDIAWAWADRLEDPALLWEKMVLHREFAGGGQCFCALGVLCQMYIEAKPTAPGWQDLGTHGEVRFLHGEGYTLPVEVQAWSGVKSRVGIYHPTGGGMTHPWRSIAQDAAQGQGPKAIADTIRIYWDIL